jgi:hypothetical protein
MILKFSYRYMLKAVLFFLLQAGVMGNPKRSWIAVAAIMGRK